MNKSKPLLEVKNLEVRFLSGRGAVTAVDNISFTLNHQETIAIVGESGSGKSVTSLSIMQLIQQPPGKIAGGEIFFQSNTFGQVDLLQLNDKQLQKVRGNEISMIFQEPMTSLNPVFTCGSQVAEVLIWHQKLTDQEAKERTLSLFERVRLPRPEKIFKAYPHEISGGQKQRVMIAMAMACKPAVVIADEPTTALDVTVQAHILELLNELRIQNNTSIIFITHDLGVVAEIADRVIVMYKGKVVEQGGVMEIFTNPQHPYTQALLACRPKLSLGKKYLPIVSDFMGVDASGNIYKKETISTPEFVIKETDSSPKPQQEKPILTVDNLQVYFPIRKGLFTRSSEFIKAVDGVSFSVFPQETIALVGESGCGKTTLGRALLRLVKPTGGNIYFNNLNIAGLSDEAMRKTRKNFQMIFQDPYASLNPMQTIGDALIEPMRVHKVLLTEKERREKVYELLEKVNLGPEHFHRYPHEFSGGQRQRISIARALALEPKCIICDESVSALDVSVQAQVLNLLNKLKREYGITYIFITHDLAVARFMADKILVMQAGKIVESGTAEAIYTNPQHPYTRTLLAAIPKGEIEDIKNALEKRETMLRQQV
ncbi:ABC transporter ATP-binding protein [Adhaeribacter aquaticus]|uniref:ABC transporter ATP-binding protein n=1 Tax=Adhaeribacter aquaticus TaxID=299567 RepID=UPI0004797A54|nr:ABC transporter ATP-binding protein [Adhaeribacter aquaticus]